MIYQVKMNAADEPQSTSNEQEEDISSWLLNSVLKRRKTEVQHEQDGQKESNFSETLPSGIEKQSPDQAIK